MATFYDDTFTEASDTGITSHTPDIGGAYTTFGGSGAVVKAGLGYIEESATVLHQVEQAATPADNLQTLTFDFISIDAANTFMSFYLRKTAGGSACYRADITASSRTIRKIDSGGTETVIATDAGFTYTLGAQYTGAFSIDGSGNLSLTTTGRSALTATDGTVTAVGKVGFNIRSARMTRLTGTDGTAAAPVITGASGTGSVLTGSGSCSTTGSTGLLWWKADTSSTASDPGAGSEAGAGWTSQAVSGSGTQTVASFGALTAGTKYVHYLHVDGSSNRSTVADSSSFTVLAAAANAPRTFRPLFLNL